MTEKRTTRIGLVAAALLAVSLPGCHSCGCGWLDGHLAQWRRTPIPDRLPLGSVNRAHWHTQEANGEAADFIFHRNDFVGNTAELTPDAKDRILEVGARMRSAPFPVLVERELNNADPELDSARREVIAAVLYDLGNADAYQRTVVSPSYGKGINSREAATDYYRFIFTRQGGFGNGGFNGGGGGGGFGGGGFGF